MFEEKSQVMVFRKTLKKLILELEALQKIKISNFKDKVEECFEEYDYKDVEEVSSMDNWPDLSIDGEYELEVGIAHEDAYVLTIHAQCIDSIISIKKVL